jgi:hypothetical protein
MKNTILFCFFSFISSALTAQRVLLINDLSFKNEKEKQAHVILKKSNKNPDSTLWAHCVAYQNETAYSDLTTLLRPILEKGQKDDVAQKNIKSQEKWIQNNVIEALFKIYIDEAKLNDLTNKRYNSSTAAIMLAYVFEKLNVGYVLTSEANQLAIFLGTNVNKQTLNIKNTSTNIDQYIDALKDLEIIEEGLLMTQSRAEIYANFKGNIAHQVTFEDATADIYLKVALQHIREKTFADALNAIEKSVFLQKEPWKEHIRGTILLKLTNQIKPNDFKTYQPFFELVYFPELEEKSLEFLMEQFNEQTEKNLVKNINLEKQQKMLRHYLERLGSYEEYCDQLKITHHTFSLDSYIFQGKKEAALKHADTVFMIAPRNIQLHSSFAGVLLKHFYSDLLLRGDFVKIETLTQQFYERFPFVKDNEKIKLVANAGKGYRIAYCLEDEHNAACVNDFYTLKDKSYEEMKVADAYLTETVFARMYSALCAYYFQKSNFKKGNEILEEGIKLCPNDSDLRRKYDTHKEYFKSESAIKVEYAEPKDFVLPPMPPPPVKKKKN